VSIDGSAGATFCVEWPISCPGFPWYQERAAIHTRQRLPGSNRYRRIMTLFSILIIGFLLGMKHATESDHLAAVASLATRQHSFVATLRQGIAWGLGHTITLMIVGSAVLALGTAMPEKMGRALELCVGVMLVGLGVDVMRRMLRQRIHFHVHRHGGEAHFHAHGHAPAPSHKQVLPRLPLIGAQHASELPVLNLKLNHALTPHDHEHASKLPFRALAVGMMHGLAGSAALVLLSLQTVQSVPMGILYILLFGLGSIIGMALLSAVIAIPLRLSGRYLTAMHRSFAACIGLATLSLGAWMIVRIGFIEGLLLG
jgi:hypothetical protein